ncbi:MAG: hypothetical protein K2J28_04220 [Duncaniella sp.]|nr:hypothetical protein [Duncaniella sp.]
MSRKGVIDKAGTRETFGLLDELSIDYTGNRLSSVSALTDALPFDGLTGVGLDKGSMAVGYDASGRLSSDARRGIVSVGYDNDGHPVRTVFKDGNEQRDVWDGLGNHLATRYYNRAGASKEEPYLTKTYAGDGQIEITSGPALGSVVSYLSYTSFPGGYFNPDGPHYYITDHQGNHTAVVDSSPKITEENNYYPYGEPWRENNGDPFMFSGNERLLIDGLNDYDFHARRYNSAVPAFSSWDALNEQYPWLSPYAYCAGNPINLTDPSGNRIVTWSNGIEWELRYEEEYNFYNTVNNSTEFWNDAFMVEVIKGIGELSKGDVGKLLIDNLIESSETIEIKYINDLDNKESSYFNYAENIIGYNFNDTRSGPAINDNFEITDLRPSYIGLAHEMAHAYDKIVNQQGSSLIWEKIGNFTIPYSDIFAGNMENCIRYEHGLPIRIAYKSQPNILFSQKARYYFSEIIYKLMFFQMQSKKK